MRSAIISACDKFRYRLERDIEPSEEALDLVRMFGPSAGPVPLTIAFFGINPSTADAMLDDATVRKWVKFARREDATRIIVGNIFSYRSTDPKNLGRVAKHQGPEHWQHLQQIIDDADMLVPCWGSRDKVPKRLHDEIDLLLGTLLQSEKPLRIFGLTNSADPKHPLFLPDDTPLVAWE